MVNISDITPEAANHFGIRDTEGVVVARVVPRSPAEKAGLQAGDVIRRFNGRQVPDKVFLRSRVAELDVHSKVELAIVRNGQEMNLTALIAEAPPGLNAKPEPIRP
jgi:S1-C subfamily serine protease